MKSLDEKDMGAKHGKYFVYGDIVGDMPLGWLLDCHAPYNSDIQPNPQLRTHLHTT